MSVPTNQQQQLITKYFNLLVEEFITDPRHNKDISIVFQDHLESFKENTTTMGHTTQSRQDHITWQVINGVKDPSSEKITTTYKYTITFSNHYKDENELRGTVVHEFTHLYLYSTIGNHGHDKRFYSAMEWLEDWLNKNQGLSPRVNKSHDYDQYEGDHSEVTNDKENTCPECFCPSPHHFPSCSHDQNQPLPTKWPVPQQKPDITNDPQKAAEFDRLKNLLKTSQNLAALESTYQKIKTNPLYKGENNNKKTLDYMYQQQKHLLQFSNNIQHPSTQKPDPSFNKGGMGKREYLLIILAIVGIVFIAIIGYLIMSENQTPTRLKKRRRVE